MSYEKNRAELIDSIIDRDGYIHCEHCGNPKPFKLHCHHIMFKSEYRHHKEINNKLNLIIVCDEPCHSNFHGKKKEMRKELVIERNLIQLFK